MKTLTQSCESFAVLMTTKFVCTQLPRCHAFLLNKKSGLQVFEPHFPSNGRTPHIVQRRVNDGYTHGFIGVDFSRSVDFSCGTTTGAAAVTTVVTSSLPLSEISPSSTSFCCGLANGFSCERGN